MGKYNKFYYFHIWGRGLGFLRAIGRSLLFYRFFRVFFARTSPAIINMDKHAPRKILYVELLG